MNTDYTNTLDVKEETSKTSEKSRVLRVIKPSSGYYVIPKNSSEGKDSKGRSYKRESNGQIRRVIK